MSVTLAVSVNGRSREVPAGATLADLVRALDLEGKRIAVEMNGEVVPRSRHAATPLAAGDRVEIVGAVGGG
jgi:sulfur carrier protein